MTRTEAETHRPHWPHASLPQSARPGPPNFRFVPPAKPRPRAPKPIGTRRHSFESPILKCVICEIDFGSAPVQRKRKARIYVLVPDIRLDERITSTVSRVLSPDESTRTSPRCGSSKTFGKDSSKQFLKENGAGPEMAETC